MIEIKDLKVVNDSQLGKLENNKSSLIPQIRFSLQPKIHNKS
jgi:hypothetical protein